MQLGGQECVGLSDQRSQSPKRSGAFGHRMRRRDFVARSWKWRRLRMKPNRRPPRRPQLVLIVNGLDRNLARITILERPGTGWSVRIRGGRPCGWQNRTPRFFRAFGIRTGKRCLSTAARRPQTRQVRGATAWFSGAGSHHPGWRRSPCQDNGPTKRKSSTLGLDALAIQTTQ